MEIKLYPEISPELRQIRQRFGIVGNSPQLLTGLQRAIQVAPIDLSVLITGESGTGKEFFPKIIHSFSSRKHARYIAVNCGAIPEGTIDSELFGHEKGAFTGAVGSRKGYFEEADGGTIFLDEVGELPLTTQARLLRVLESGEFLKVGSSTMQRTNVRIVAATNVDMARAIEQGRFREDLYYRLSTVGITVPPLRERGADIALLARKFAYDFAEKYTMPEITLGADARDVLTRYRWPGNIRQLKNIIEQMGLFEAGRKIDAAVAESYIPAGGLTYTPAVADGRGHAGQRHNYDDEREVLFNMVFRLQRELESMRAVVDRLSAASPAGAGIDAAPLRLEAPKMLGYTPTSYDSFEPADTPADTLADTPAETPAETPVETVSGGTLEDAERRTIEESLARNGGNRKLTAAELKISERTLYRKLKEWGAASK